jgi:hypothetical protein
MFLLSIWCQSGSLSSRRQWLLVLLFGKKSHGAEIKSFLKYVDSNWIGEVNLKTKARKSPAYSSPIWNKHSATIEGKHRTNHLSEGYNRAFALSLSASPSDWHIRFRTEEVQTRQSMFQAVKGNVDTENSTSRKCTREHREDQLRNVVTNFSNVTIKVFMESIMTFFD